MAGLAVSRGRGDTVIEFRDVSRRFLLRHERRISFQDWFVGLLRPRGKAEEFWALRDISFSVRRGEALGILGRNGAGKSTLLKLMTRVLEPTGGDIAIDGRIHAMLELGAGFHPELSGRDNIYLNGSIYGFSRRHMSERFDRIVQFAELERFIDTPVKHYSSGMFMRLGFAIAMHMDPEILVIDEVLGVGDTAFQRKGYQAMRDLKATGTTTVFVSHNPEQIREFCDRAILLQEGRLIDSGPADDVIDHYLRTLQEQQIDATILRIRAIDAVGLPAEEVRSGDDLTIEVLLRLPPGTATANLLLALDLFDSAETHLFGSTRHLPETLPSASDADPATRRVRAVLRDLPLAEGPLTVAATLQRSLGLGSEQIDRQETRIDVIEPWSGRERGILRLNHAWEWESAPDGVEPVPDAAARAAERSPR